MFALIGRIYKHVWGRLGRGDFHTNMKQNETGPPRTYTNIAFRDWALSIKFHQSAKNTHYDFAGIHMWNYGNDNILNV